MKLSALAATAAVASLVVTGCTAHPDEARTPAAQSKAPGPPITRSTIGTVELNTDVNSPMAIGHVGGDIVVLPTQEPGAPSWNTVTVVDPAAGTSRAVAHSAWPRGLINWVATVGDWVVYTDQSHTQGDGSYEALWRI